MSLRKAVLYDTHQGVTLGTNYNPLICKWKYNIIMVQKKFNKIWTFSGTWQAFLLQTFSGYQKERGFILWSRLVAVDVPMLLHPAPPLHVDVFGSQPGVSAQRRLSQAQRQQPVQQRHSQSKSDMSLQDFMKVGKELGSSKE